ncbi:MAG: hypothetical protein FJ303_08645 [Planctomycetes bacterium]|nr:hypothetical protein [Planctomycetota bacterium]
MVLIATDILADLCSVSLGLLIALVPVGLLLWLFGWLGHRFWIVLAATVLAGLFGLLEATTWRVQPIVVAVLLAVAAGVLALAMVRVLTFAAGGFGGAFVVNLIFPTWEQHVICFLVSGLLCLLLFRWFFMALTSFTGTILLAYATLALLHFNDVLDAVTWSDDNAQLLSILCGIAAFAGFAFQFSIDRASAKDKEKADDDEDESPSILARIGFGGSSKSEAA